MKVFTSNSNHRVFKLNAQDQKIITLIYFGVSSRSTIAHALNVSGPAITQKIIKFEKAGYVVSKESEGIKDIKRVYVITRRGRAFVEKEIWCERFVAY